jgi:hypothetical protein
VCINLSGRLMRKTTLSAKKKVLGAATDKAKVVKHTAAVNQAEPRVPGLPRGCPGAVPDRRRTIRDVNHVKRELPRAAPLKWGTHTAFEGVHRRPSAERLRTGNAGMDFAPGATPRLRCTALPTDA